MNWYCKRHKELLILAPHHLITYYCSSCEKEGSFNGFLNPGTSSSKFVISEKEYHDSNFTSKLEEIIE